MKNIVSTVFVALSFIGVCSTGVFANAVIPSRPQTEVDYDHHLEQSTNAFIQQLRKDMAIETGLSVAIVRGGRTVYLHNFGYANLEQHIPVNNNTLFYIASVTKPLFALSTLCVLQQSHFTIDSSLATLLPQVDFPARIPARHISLRQLLNHTSGLTDNVLENNLYLSGLHNKASRLAMLKALQPNSQKPLGQFDYTNLGYNIVSVAMEQSMGKSWQQAIQQCVLSPAGMTHTTADIDGAINSHKQDVALPYSYFVHPGQHLNLMKSNNTLHSAGGLFSTSSDLARFITLELNAGKLERKQVIPAKLISLSQQPSITFSPYRKGEFKRTGYALGWYIGPYKGHRLYHHFGEFDGFRPHLSFMPDKGIGVVILDNEGMLNDKLTDLIADFVYSTLLGQPDPTQQLLKRAKSLKVMALKYRQHIIQKEQSYAQRPYSLSLSATAYAGDYANPLAGHLLVRFDGQHFNLQWGRAHSQATAYNKIDTVRIKFRPTRPQGISFNLDTGKNKVRSLVYDGITFIKQ